jgi:hypothetical protein
VRAAGEAYLAVLGSSLLVRYTMSAVAHRAASRAEEAPVVVDAEVFEVRVDDLG